MPLRRALVLVLAGALAYALAGCGGSHPSAESVVRAWSQALNSDDNEAAANLFAKGARIIQGGNDFRLVTHADAVAWNAALPCSGKILAITTRGNLTTATFILGDRKSSKCDGPGARTTAVFKVRNGKITLWHQTATQPGGPVTSV